MVGCEGWVEAQTGDVDSCLAGIELFGIGCLIVEKTHMSRFGVHRKRRDPLFDASRSVVVSAYE